jgi:hypothetical protein
VANLRQELETLMAPDMPRPLPPVTDPIYQAWRKSFQAYVDRRSELRMSLNELGGIHAFA